MSLVDASYGSDDSDDVEEDAELPVTTAPVVGPSNDGARNATDTDIAPSVSLSASSMIEGLSRRGGEVVPRSESSAPDVSPRIRLPDVSDLLGPSSSDAIAAISDTQKKRSASNGPAHSLPRAKVPRGNLHPARVAPDTAGGMLTPPQLRGRSNVATEDLDKIFTRRQKR